MKKNFFVSVGTHQAIIIIVCLGSTLLSPPHLSSKLLVRSLLTLPRVVGKEKSDSETSSIE